jgi:hypothetical protein
LGQAIDSGIYTQDTVLALRVEDEVIAAHPGGAHTHVDEVQSMKKAMGDLAARWKGHSLRSFVVSILNYAWFGEVGHHDFLSIEPNSQSAKRLQGRVLQTLLDFREQGAFPDPTVRSIRYFIGAHIAFIKHR